jgi:hypothetical protein
MDAGGAILALDAATRTGVCEGPPGETLVLETVSFKRELDDDFDIWARAQAWAIRRINAAADAGRPIGMAVVEGLVPQYDKTIQCGIYAVFGAVARNKRIPIMWAMPQTWRAVVLGDGKLKTAVAKTRAVVSELSPLQEPSRDRAYHLCSANSRHHRSRLRPLRATCPAAERRSSRPSQRRHQAAHLATRPPPLRG